MENQKYLDCIERINKHFKDCYADIVITDDCTKQELLLKKQRFLLFRILLLAHIDLRNNEVIEGEETKYMPGIKTLLVNPNDSIEYVEKVIVSTILNNILEAWPLLDFNYNKKLFLMLFINTGLIKVASKRTLNGSKEIVVSNYTNLICASMHMK